MKRKPPTQGGTVTHSETPTQARIDHDRTRSKSECDGATEVNAKLEGWQEKQRVSTTCRSDIKPALQPCKNCRKPRGRERINYPDMTPRDKKRGE